MTRRKTKTKKRNPHQLQRARPEPQRARPEPQPARPEPQPAPPPAAEREVDLIGEFVADKGVKDPERVSFVLSESLWGVRSIRDLLAGRWVFLASHRVADAWVPGYRAGRVYQTIERFARWLQARGYIDEWSRDHLLHEIDEARYAHGLRNERAPERGKEQVASARERDAIAARFGSSLAHPMERELAPSALRVLESHLELQLGPGQTLLFGALDVDAFVVWILGGSCAEIMESDCTLLAILAAFYRWLGDTGRLDHARASAHAGKLAAAALGTQLALGSCAPASAASNCARSVD